MLTLPQYLLTVNAGSNTVSLFTIPKDDILHPKLACSPVSTLGEFPQSIAYSPLHKTGTIHPIPCHNSTNRMAYILIHISACVLNGGAIAGITCYSVSSSGLKTLGGLRPISLNETTPPVGPAGTVSDIIFNPSQTALIATVKGNGMDAGFIYAYRVSWGGTIATKPIVSRPSELAVDFSISFLGSDSRAIVTDPSYGASIVEVNSQYEFSVQKKIPVAGEKAICWSVFSRGYDTVFIFDGGVTGITMIDPWSGAIKGTIPGAKETMANLDAQTWKQYMYVLNGAAYVSVVDNSALERGETPSEVQNFDLSGLGSRQGFQGMAVYPSGEGW